jgi:hypothetical protein
LTDHPDVVSLGDTYPSNRFDQVCGCGAYVSQCPFWKQVGERVGAERYRDFPHLLPNYPAILSGRWDRLLYNMLSPRLLRRLIPKSLRDGFAQDFEAFAAAVHENAGRPEASVYVDGVKSISRVYALAASGVRVDGVIHLQRDPGDYIQSTMKQEGRSWRVFLTRLLSWRMFHNRARRIGEEEVPYFSLTYEGLADRPDETLRDLFAFLGASPMSVRDLVGQSKDAPWHFMGNASLFHFDGNIRRSRHEQSPAERRMVRLLAGPYPKQALHWLRDST